MKKNKINIVFVIHDANPVPYFNWFAQKAMSSSEYNFSFIFLNNDFTTVKQTMEPFNCNIYHIPFDNSNKKKSLAIAFIKLISLFRLIKPDIVHSHLFYDGVIALWAAKIAGVKIRIQTKQSTGFNWYFAPKAVPLDRFKNRMATHLIAVSEEARQFVIEKEEVRPAKVKMFHHGVDLEETILSNSEQVEFLKKKYNPQGKSLVIMVARYIEWKGYRYFIQASAEVLKNNKDVLFLGVGTGPQHEELQKLINELGIQDSFILTGFIDKKLIPALYQISDIYVHSAIREPFGFVIAEAMINKLPIVSTPTGAAGDAINHLENGYIVPYKDVTALVKGISFYLGISSDERKIFGEKAAATARELFSFENMWNSYTNLYRQAYLNVNE